MLVWSTILPLKPNNSLDKIYGVCKQWLEGSPHSKLKEKGSLPESIAYGMTVFEEGNEKVETYLFTNALGFKYVVSGEETSWRTELAFFPSEKMVAAYIRIYLDTNGLTYKKPAVKSPYLVKLLVKICGCEDDGPFPCTSRALQMRYSEASALAALITGRGRTLLPVVYIRPTFEWNRVSYEMLEKWIGARAHIVYSPGPNFDRSVATLSNHPLYPPGSITVFVPQAKHPVTLPRYRYIALSRQMADAAILVRDATLQATGTLGPGLEAIRAASTRNEYDKMRKEFAEKSAENSAFVKYADREITSLEERVTALDARNQYLENEINRLAAKAGESANVSFTLKEASPLYTDELKDAIIHTLKSGAKTLNVQGRYVALISDILANNPKSGFESSVSQALNKLLRANRNVQRGDFAEVEKLGFVYHAGNKHHQIVFKDEESLMCTIGKTPSDHRSGLNNISQILKRLFQ